jgi:hypothetical protein
LSIRKKTGGTFLQILFEELERTVPAPVGAHVGIFDVGKLFRVVEVDVDVDV